MTKSINQKRIAMVNVRCLRVVRRLWVQLGGKVVHVPRTGEERYSHPMLPRPITVNCRRKDTPRKLEQALRKVA